MRSISSGMFTLGGIWRNESATCRHHYINCGGGIIPTANNQGSKFRRKAETFTYHLSVKFLAEYGIGQVQGDQLAARECYLAMLVMDKHMQTMSIDERRIVAEPIEVLEDVPLDENKPKNLTTIGVSMEKKTKQDLTQFLKKSTDVFT